MANQPAIYSVVIVDSNDEWHEITEYTSLKYMHSLNKGSIASLTIPLNKITAAQKATRNSWIRISRKTSVNAEEKLVWYGKLIQPTYKGNATSGMITLQYEDLASLLKYRYTSDTLSITTATEQAEVLFDRIDDTQNEANGDLGITQGANPTSKTRTAETELQKRSVLNILESWAEFEDGLDWEITPTTKNSTIGIFNTYFRGTGQKYHKGSEVKHPLVYVVDASPETMKTNNVDDYTIMEQGDVFANKVTVLGQEVDGVQLSSTAEDTVSQGIYGLVEKQVQATDLSVQSTIDDRASEELNASNLIPRNIKMHQIPNTSPRIDEYDVGDIFNVEFKAFEAVSFESQYRLYRRTVIVDSDGVENIDLELNII